ncbi:MAG TPA: hypothetical protein VNC82_17495 [Candidatus Limnocylindria bacterium]|nr:hypothetical protein [Candidatus Limnocylindria bacterium]
MTATYSTEDFVRRAVGRLHRDEYRGGVVLRYRLDACGDCGRVGAALLGAA